SDSPRPPASKAPDTTPDPLHPRRPTQAEPAQDLEALCRAVTKAGGRGAALEATAWQRLVEAAGGESHVPTYCAGKSGPAPSGLPGTHR
ncbi:hypothetical protein P8605_46955, partial [Streptomyces sp. T-3]|nr:hypothetical protein [Streptomyces sp. T-3]